MDWRPASRTATALLIVALAGGCITVIDVPGGSSAPETLPIASGADQTTPLPAGPVPSPITGHLQLGDPSTAERGVLGPAGGSIAIDRPGDPLDGVALEVPAGAYTTDTSFTIGARPITGHDFGPLIKPVSALITVDNGGGYAELPVSLRIPAAIPADAVAGAWFYDDATGRLEGVPILERDETSITVLTRHFSSIFLSIAEAGLPDVVDSGFVPALDAWEIPNPGSYPEWEGYCEGSAITAMWYFLEEHRALGAAHLFGTYDNNGGAATPTLWDDDADAIRLVTTVQHNTDWDRRASTFFRELRPFEGARAYDAFRYAIAVTGEPQYVAVRNARGGHAMIVYKVDPAHLWVADPNFPGDGSEARSIPFDWGSKTLGSYVGSETFETIIYAAKTAVVPWSDVAAAWTMFEAGTIGDDVFPAYQLRVGPQTNDPNSGPQLTNRYLTSDATLSVRLVPHFGAGLPGRLTVFRGTERVASGGDGPAIAVPLEDGENELGFLVEGYSPAMEFRWVDFQRLTVVRGPAVGWRLVGGPTEVSRVPPVCMACPEQPQWDLTGGPGSLTSRVSDPFGLGMYPESVFVGWTAPPTLIPFDDLGSLAAPGPNDGFLVIDPVIGFAVDGAATGPAESAVARLNAFLQILPDRPAPGALGASVGAILFADGSVTASAPHDVQVPGYPAGTGSGTYSTKMWLEVQVHHEGAEVIYQYEYEWTGQP